MMHSPLGGPRASSCRFVLACACLLPAIAEAQLRLNTTEAGDQTNAAVTLAAGGEVAAVWSNLDETTSGEIVGQRLDGAGRVGSEFLAFGGPSAGHPAMARLPTGEFVVVWDTATAPASGDVFGRAFMAAGLPSGPVFQVTGPAPRVQARPTVAIDGAGHLLVAWMNELPGFSASFQIVGAIFDGAGMPLVPEFAIGSPAGNEVGPAAVVDGAGNFWVAWSRNRVLLRRYDTGGVALGPEFDVDATLPFTGTAPALAVDPGGNVVAVWHVPSGGTAALFGRRFDTSGTPVGPSFQINERPVEAIAPTWSFLGPGVAVAPSGDIVAVWVGRSGTVPEIRARRLDGSGVPIGPEVTVSSERRSFAPGVAVDGSDVATIVWESQEESAIRSDVFAQRLDPAGVPQYPRIMSGKKLSLKDNPVDPSRRKIAFTLRSTAIETAPGVGIDPLGDGATVQVYGTGGTGDVACFSLVTSGSALWTQGGDPAAPTFRYRDRDGVNGACKRARIKNHGVLSVACDAKTAPIAYTLDEPGQGRIAIRFTSGSTTYCAEFGGNLKKDMPRLFVATGAPLPGECPPAPACP
jgi:hypothetical protein